MINPHYKFAFLVLGSLIISISSVSAQAAPLPFTPTVTISPSVSPTPTTTITDITPTPTPTKRVTMELGSAIGDQSAWNKRIPITLTIKPLVNGRKIVINWQKRTGIEASPLNAEILNPIANQVYTLQFSMTPQSIGYQRTVAEIILVTDTENFIMSKDIVVTLNQDKVVVPITAGYQTMQLFMYISIFVFFIVVVPASLFFGGKYFQKTILPKWYEKQIQKPQR